MSKKAGRTLQRFGRPSASILKTDSLPYPFFTWLGRKDPLFALITQVSKLVPSVGQPIVAAAGFSAGWTPWKAGPRAEIAAPT
jgi:hypothetical protein